VCHKENKVLTETTRFLSVKRHPELRLDLCDKHVAEVKKLSIHQYVKRAMGLSGIEMTEEQAKQYLTR
jgi:hypothetical protein